jgi:radical SAM superfamily enzyme YgiQ (UPF0313 family)
MHYEGTVIRPPSEANSIILQVTVGCSHNKCTFCGAYKDVTFRLKDQQVIDEDLSFAARYSKRQSRVFLADGDVLILSQQRLVSLLEKIKANLPWVNRVSLYANTKSIRSKTVSQLRELKKLGLNRVYMGLESGHDPTLERVNKGADSAAMIDAAQKVKEAGLFLSVTVLLGIGGLKDSKAHAESTGRVLSSMSPNQIGVLTLMLLPNTPLYAQQKEGNFLLPDQTRLLEELRTMVEHLEIEKAQLQTNHASNYLSINARLSRDKKAVLNRIDQALRGKVELVQERFRAL